MHRYGIFSPYVRYRKDSIIRLSSSQMRALRSTWRVRMLAGLLAASLLSMVFLPVGQEVSTKGTASYAAWLRAQVKGEQVKGETDAAFDEALTAAEASKAHSLHGFLTAFIEAYVEEASSEELAKAFAAGDRSGAELLRYLERHYLRLAGGEQLGYGSLAAAAPPLLKLDRLANAVPGAHLLQCLDTLGSAQLAPWAHTPLFVFSLRTLFSAQPLGP